VQLAWIVAHNMLAAQGQAVRPSLQQKQYRQVPRSLGHQEPLSCSPDAAALSPSAGETVAGSAGASSTAQSAAAAAAAPGIARFHEGLSIKGLRLSASVQLVFELYCAKPSVAGLPSKELLVAWAATPVLQGGQVGATLFDRHCLTDFCVNVFRREGA
jgi:hypothetical protein